MRTLLFFGFLIAAASCSAVPKLEEQTITEQKTEEVAETEEITLEACLEVEIPPEHCWEVLQTGCESENPDACFRVAKAALKDSPELYREGMEKACKAGSKVACSARHNIAIDAKLPDYQTSCDSGDPWACLKAGTVLDRSKERLMSCTSLNSTDVGTCAAGDARGCWASAASLFLAPEYQNTIREFSVGWNTMYSQLRKGGVNDSSFAELVASCRDGDAVSCLDAADFIGKTEPTQKDLACIAGLTSQLCRPDLEWGCHSPLYLITPGNGGRLSQSDVWNAIHAIFPEVNECYRTQLGKNPGIKGDVKVEFEVTLNSTVSSAFVSNTTLHDEATENCILGVIRQIVFPKPRGGKVTVVFPFRLSPEKAIE